MAGSLYDGSTDGLYGFQEFLEMAASVPGLLPPWWNEEKQEACETLGMDDEFSNLRYPVEKSDIIEHYGDREFPMQLRMLAEAVYGSVGGSDGTAMRRMMVAMEGGELGNDGYGSVF